VRVDLSSSPGPITYEQMIRELTLSELAHNKDWPSIELFFRANEPKDAEQYQVRALLRINQALGGIVDWFSVLSDLQQACKCSPLAITPRINLIQSLMDAGFASDAFIEAQKLKNDNQDSPLILEKFALAAFRVGRWEDALGSLIELEKFAHQHLFQTEPLGRLYGQLKTRWWRPIVASGISLSLPSASDTEMLTRSFDHPVFLKQIQRSKLSSTHFVRGLVARANRSPFETRQIDWVIKIQDLSSIGIASLVDIDFKNRRAELLIGFPKICSNLSAVKACVNVINIAFFHFNLEKLVSYVYSDNSRAQANTLHLGFCQEGVLRSHIADGKDRVDMYINGLLKTDWITRSFCKRLHKRFISE